MEKVVSKSSVVKEATRTGVHVRSPRQRGTVSNLYHLVKSLAKVSAVLMRTDALQSAAQLLADDLSLKIECAELSESHSIIESEDESESDDEEESVHD